MDLEFGSYRLKRAERLLLGPKGPVELSARSFDILNMLLERPDEVIGKTELFDAVWPGMVVEENTLQVHISALRKALPPGMIVTVHGRGYKYGGPRPFAADLVTASEGASPSRKPVIVVLPFQDLAGDPGQQYFSDGITQDITDRLTHYRLLSVIGEHSAAAFRGEIPDFAAVRDKLKADFVVTGNIRRSAGRIRVAARLTDASSQTGIWAEHYDRPMSDLFAMQDEIANLVAAAVARLLEVEINTRIGSKLTASLSSYEHMLQGYWQFKKLTRAGNIIARGCFERAVASDPGNAEALCWLGITYCERWVQDFSREDALKGAKLCGEAVAIDPANAHVHALYGFALLCVNDLDGAVRATDRGMMLNPGDANVVANRALICAYEGRIADGQNLFAQAHKQEPLPPLWFGEFAAVIAFAAGRYEEAAAGVEPIPEMRLGHHVCAGVLRPFGPPRQGRHGIRKAEGAGHHHRLHLWCAMRSLS
jgi:TolB-like protein